LVGDVTHRNGLLCLSSRMRSPSTIADRFAPALALYWAAAAPEPYATIRVNPL
jgi:hypothetical protein